jgi:hypothetical protein
VTKGRSHFHPTGQTTAISNHEPDEFSHLKPLSQLLLF